LFSMMSQQSLDELCFATSAADSMTLAPLSVGCRVAAPVGVCESAEPPSPQPDNRPAARKQPTATANTSSETAARLLRPSMSFAYPRRQELYRSLNSSECVSSEPRMPRRVDLSARGCVCPGLSTGPSGFSAWNGNRDSNPTGSSRATIRNEGPLDALRMTPARVSPWSLLLRRPSSSRRSCRRTPPCAPSRSGTRR
jgi:hypothetical protein